MVKEEVLKENDNLKFVKEQEFLHGERPDGSRIGYYRSASYKKRKELKNPLAGGKVDLIQTGAFVGSAFVKSPQAGIFNFGFTNSKAPSLLEKYNSGESGQKSILNINENSWRKFQSEIIKPRFKLKIQRQLGQR